MYILTTTPHNTIITFNGVTIQNTFNHLDACIHNVNVHTCTCLSADEALPINKHIAVYLQTKFYLFIFHSFILTVQLYEL